MKKIFFAFSLIIAVAMTACTPETLNERLGIPEDAILLSSERFSDHGTKTSVSDISVKWVNEDKVYLNGSEYSVTVDNSGNAYVNASDEIRSSEVYGFYGVSGTPSWNSSTKKLSVTVPSEYTSSYDGGRQVIALPMVAYKSGAANKIEFKHVSAAIKVRIKNTTGANVYLDSVVVSNSTYQLSGTTSELNLTASDLELSANSSDVAASDKRVRVAFAYKAVTIENGGTDVKEVQVPILPIGSDANLTIKVYTHKLVARTGMPSVNYDYNFAHTSTIPAALTRNVMITAQVEIKQKTDDVNNHITEVDHSLFTIRTGSYGSYVYTPIRFSRGNLQYVPKTGTWSFHDNQYDICESTTQGWATSDNTSRYGSAEGTNAIDLFGWGTSGQAHGAVEYMPYTNNTTNSNFNAYNNSSSDLNTSPGTADWRYNNITGDGNGKWHTFSKDDISSISSTNNRTITSGLTGTNSSNASYTKATICGVKGVILFPDKYNHPEGLTSESGTHYFNSNSSSTYASFVLTNGDEWILMEEAGAIFLPAVGYRNGNRIYYGGSYSDPYGYYWTTTHYNANNAYPLNFSNSKYNVSTNNHGKSYGCAVRLVQNVE